MHADSRDEVMGPGKKCLLRDLFFTYLLYILTVSLPYILHRYVCSAQVCSVFVFNCYLNLGREVSSFPFLHLAMK